MITRTVQEFEGQFHSELLELLFTVEEYVEEIQFTCFFSHPSKISPIVHVYDSENRLRVQWLYKNSDSTFYLTKESNACSLAMMAGELPLGTYRIVLVTETLEKHNYRISISTSPTMNVERIQEIEHTQWACEKNSQIPFSLAKFNYSNIINSEEKWYCGDLHTHTTLSDGSLTPHAYVEQLENRKLDFVFLTDHNIVPSRMPKSNTLIIPGMEITAPGGHFNALGIRQWVNFLPNETDLGMVTNKGMNRIMLETKNQGSLVSINHPFLSKWKWLLEDTDLSLVDTIELCNDPTYSDNTEATENALKAWDILLSDGRFLVGVGGSDSHLLPTETYQGSSLPSYIGDPMTYVYAAHLSAQTLMDSIRKGQVYITRGPQLEVDLTVSEKNVLFGTTLNVTDELIYKLKINKGTYSLRWIIDGILIDSDIINENQWKQKSFCFNDNQYHYIRIELRHEDGSFVAATNPIFFGHKEPTHLTWGEILRKM